MIEFILNNKKVSTDKPSGSLLLDYVRYDKLLTGTKIGCREGDCGACTVLIGELKDGQMHYQNATSCLTPLGNVHGKHVVTIEGLNMDEMTPVQKAMIDEAGTQCGFCTVGFVVSLSSFCLSNEAPTYEGAIAAIDGNICRCTGYKSIERAAQHIVDGVKGKSGNNTINWLVDNQFIPAYFKEIPTMMKELTVTSVDGPDSYRDGMLVGGGTDLYVQKHDELTDKDLQFVVSKSLKGINVANDEVKVRAGVTVTEFMENEAINQLFPDVKKHLKLISSSPIRNIATMGGNFVNASPIGDMTAFFIALNASIVLASDNGDRKILLKDFYHGYKQLDKKEGEYIKEIIFCTPSPTAKFNFEKVSKRIHLDIASVNSAAYLNVVDGVIKSAHVSAGGIGPVPTYLGETSAYLVGKELTEETLLKANDVLQSEISPISDVRGTAEYKRLLLRQLFYAHFITLYPEQIKLEELV